MGRRRALEQAVREKKVAAVAAIWGENSEEYVLGAAALGESIRVTTPGLPRVLLCFGPENPQVRKEYLTMLEEWWEIRYVPRLRVNRSMVVPDQEDKWGVDLFMKLHTLNASVLPEFDKVLFLDTDTLVQQSLLPLFDLNAPAGHVAGCTADHGELVKEHQWPPREKGKWEVNAGVLLMEPNEAEFRRVQGEVQVSTAAKHSNTPEQTFLMHHFYGRWTHIGSAWNCVVPRHNIYGHDKIPLGNAHILHYLGTSAKPWVDTLLVPLVVSSEGKERRNDPRVTQAVRLWKRVAQRETVQRALSVINDVRGPWKKEERTVSDRVARKLQEKGHVVERDWRLPLQLKYSGTRVAVAAHEAVIAIVWRRLEHEDW